MRQSPVTGYSPLGTIVLESGDTGKSLGEFGIDNLTSEEVEVLLADCNASDEDKGVLLAQKGLNRM